MLKSKFSLSRHFEYANEQITYHFWLCLFLRNSRRKSGVGKMNGTVITNRLQNSFKIKDNNVYGSSYYWNFRTSSFKQVTCLILLKTSIFNKNMQNSSYSNIIWDMITSLDEMLHIAFYTYNCLIWELAQIVCRKFKKQNTS
jgi:hypothetical protein